MRTTRGYWSDTFRNKHGEDLQTCLEKYGYGVERDVHSDMKITAIFLDDEKEFSNSWLIRIDVRNTFTRARLYSEDPEVRIKLINLP